MAVFLGNTGNVRLRRGTEANYGRIADSIDPNDVNTILNRLSFDSALDNLLTGDRVTIKTNDARKLICFDPTAWPSGTLQSSITAYVNVNSAGGLRFFRNFADAVNNNRAQELALDSFAGDPITITVYISDFRFSVLGNVTSFELNTDRQMIETTTLNDRFQQQYSAGLISGNGSINCLFDYNTSGQIETPLLMLQLIQRTEIGSEFDCALYLTDNELDSGIQNVYYEFTACVTRAGVQVSATDAITCSIDFVTTGEIRLLVGEPTGYTIVTEADEPIELEQSLDELITQELD